MSGITVVHLEPSQPHKRGDNLQALRHAALLLEQQPKPGAPDPYLLADIREAVAWIRGNRRTGVMPRETGPGIYKLGDPEFGGAETVAFVAALLASVALDMEGLDPRDNETKKCLLRIDAAAGHLLAVQA